LKPVFYQRLRLLLAIAWEEEFKRLQKEGSDESPSIYKLLFDVDQKLTAAEAKPHRDYLYGTDFSLTFLKGTSGRTLAWPAFQMYDYYKALLDSGFFEEWGYWDNTDEPEDVIPRQWTARGKEWASAMGENFRPIEKGLTWEYKPMLLLDFTPGRLDWDALEALSEKPDSAFAQWCRDYKEKSKKDPWGA
jgi:hypothetical protein